MSNAKKGESDLSELLCVGGKYNFISGSERLIYIGKSLNGSGAWHQFVKVENPGRVWSELLDSDLHLIEPST